MDKQYWTLVLYISSLLGVLGSFWILQEKRLPNNVFKKLLHSLAIVDCLLAVALSLYGFVNYEFIDAMDSIIPLWQGLILAFVFLGYLYYLVGFCIAFIPIYIIVFKGTVNTLNKLPLVQICFVGAVFWTVIVEIGLQSSNYVRIVSAIAFLFVMFLLMCICFTICWKELYADKTKRRNVQTFRNFDEREFHSKQASVKMTRFSGSFALIQLTLILPALMLGNTILVNQILFAGNNNSINEIEAICELTILVSFSASGFFHALAVHFGLFYKFKKWKFVKVQQKMLPKPIPKHKLATTTFHERDLPQRPDMVHLFTGQRRTLVHPDTIDLIKS
ncbi:hypothetical protein HDV06_000526 [Boothiomyces sp. JEL0866]|nr:hypothetical protein HDV06_000526 [Boothiomyces sp. JEL0866]